MYTEMYKEKETFVKGVQDLLALDRRSEVESISYRIDRDTQDEYIYIEFTSGYGKTILATGNSNGANLKEIIKVVY